MKTVKDFKDFDFENCSNVPEKYWGDYTCANYYKGEFIPVVRKELKKMAKNIEAELKFSPNYFEWSAFFKKDGKFIYVHSSDARYWKWYNDILYRTAESEIDYTGGANRYCSFDKLEESLEELFRWM